MMEETYLMEHVKEQACFVSTDLKADLLTSRPSRGPHRREYVLPDGVNSTTGFLRVPAEARAGASRQQASSEQVRIRLCLGRAGKTRDDACGSITSICACLRTLTTHSSGSVGKSI